jgi:hypothetical protein
MACRPAPAGTCPSTWKPACPPPHPSIFRRGFRLDCATSRQLARKRFLIGCSLNAWPLPHAQRKATSDAQRGGSAPTTCEGQAPRGSRSNGQCNHVVSRLAVLFQKISVEGSPCARHGSDLSWDAMTGSCNLPCVIPTIGENAPSAHHLLV